MRETKRWQGPWETPWVLDRKYTILPFGLREFERGVQERYSYYAMSDYSRWEVVCHYQCDDGPDVEQVLPAGWQLRIGLYRYVSERRGAIRYRVRRFKKGVTREQLDMIQLVVPTQGGPMQILGDGPYPIEGSPPLEGMGIPCAV